MSDATRSRNGAATRQRKLLVLANEACVGSALFDEVRERAEGEAEVLVVAPALTHRLRYWMSDEDGGIAQAEARLQASVERCGAAGVSVRGEVGDPDPLQALDDAMRTFAPDEVVIATHPPDQANWLERGVVGQARARFSEVPILHLEVDAAHERAKLVEQEPATAEAPARERHRLRDLVLLGIVGVLALGGTATTIALWGAGAPEWAFVLWVLFMDLGVKVLLFVMIWILFQRRARADRLDY